MDSIYSTTPWDNWCRLCAMDKVSQVDIFGKDDEVSQVRIGCEKFFDVEITPFDEFPKMVCLACNKFLIDVEAFSNKCTKVQQLFNELFKYKTNGGIPNIKKLRQSFGLLDDPLEVLPNETEAELEADEIPMQEPTTESKFENFDEPEVEINELEYCAMEYYEIMKKEEEISDFSGDDGGACDNDDRPDSSQGDIFSEDHLKPDEPTNPDELKLMCEKCGRSFKLDRHYRAHMQKVHSIALEPPTYACTKCEKVFPSMKKCKSHEFSHLPRELKMTIPCPYCERKFSQNISVKNHILSIHSNERAYKCDDCGKHFKTPAGLRVHRVTHMEEFPFHCTVCDKKFKNKQGLKLHEDIHNDTNYVCTICGQTLNTRQTLKMHMLVHSDQKRHKCNYCGSEFKRQKTLKTHMILHTGLRPYKCEFCDKTFAIGSNLRSHKKAVHPKELAASDASGVKSDPVFKMPKLAELRQQADTQKLKTETQHPGDGDDDDDSDDEAPLVAPGSSSQPKKPKIECNSPERPSSSSNITIASTDHYQNVPIKPDEQSYTNLLHPSAGSVVANSVALPIKIGIDDQNEDFSHTSFESFLS